MVYSCLCLLVRVGAAPVPCGPVLQFRFVVLTGKGPCPRCAAGRSPPLACCARRSAAFRLGPWGRKRADARELEYLVGGCAAFAL